MSSLGFVAGYFLCYFTVARRQKKALLHAAEQLEAILKAQDRV